MRRAGPLDAAFFGLEAPEHPLHGMAVMVLDPATVPGGYSFASLRRFMESRLPGVPPLRQRSVPIPMGLARPGWVDTEVDIRAHVIKHVRRGATLRDVASFAAELATKPLDRTKPLWEMHVIEGLQDGNIAIVAKVHHSLMDGVAGMDFLAGMFSLRPEAESVVKINGGASRVPNPVTRLALAVPDLLMTPIRLTAAVLGTGHASWRFGALARRQGSSCFPRPPRMRWNGRLGYRRTIAFASLSLAEVKDISHGTGSTVNDVVLSLIGGACRTYLDNRGELPTKPLVAFVPVSTHDTDAHHQSRDNAALDEGKSQGQGAEGAGGHPSTSKPANAVALVLSTLGTDVSGPLERLDTVHEAMARAKRVHEALGGDILTQWLAVANPVVLGAAARGYLRLGVTGRLPLIANVLVSNVPGPPVPLYFGGAHLLALYPLGPVYDGIGVNVTVVSCEGVLGFGLVSSPEVLDDAQSLADGIEKELSALGRECGARAPSRARASRKA